MSDCEQSCTDGIVDYLALFNQLDKHFDKILGLEKYLPFNEKVKRLIEGDYPISWFVSLHKYQIKFLGELRNHLTHGIKLDGHTYSQPTDYALQKLKNIVKAIKKPPTCFDIFKKTVFFAKENDKLTDILPTMKNYAYTHVPVYSEQNKFIGVLTEASICYRLANKIQKKSDYSLEKVSIKDIIAGGASHQYLFLPKTTNIYQIDQIFTNKKQHKKRLGAIFITNHGKQNEKILGIITAGDVALIDTFVIH